MLLQVLLTRWLLELSKERFAVKFFVRADVDSMLPLQFLLPLLPHAAAGRCLSLVFPGLRLLLLVNYAWLLRTVAVKASSQDEKIGHSIELADKSRKEPETYTLRRFGFFKRLKTTNKEDYACKFDTGPAVTTPRSDRASCAGRARWNMPAIGRLSRYRSQQDFHFHTR